MIPRVPKRVLLGWSTQKSKLEISNGHNLGAILIKMDDSGSNRTARRGSCSGEGAQGPGIKLFRKQYEHVVFSFFTCLGFVKKNK